ncbi:MAG TPA: tetratricopeptide repeat protein [Gemmataceae bacterium]|nr:tetratricopeptide repeat protein [Gemmataceae bacterium]
MTIDPYASCPCGSGKKFKWCCQPIYANINRAFEQDAQGQHDAALRIMEAVTTEHGGNPEAWGQKAKLLYSHGKVEQAEEALEKAFAVNRNYPYGLLLKAVFRFQEGELPGALLLARRAAEAYDPEARDYLAEAYSLIYECEMKLNRPVAARAALKIVLHLQPAAEELRQAFEQTFGEKSRLPASARHEYTLMRPAPAPAGTSAAARRTAWDRALLSGQTPRLGELVRAFAELTKQDENDAAAWFNLGLGHAWLGDNAAALDGLNRYIELEPDGIKATPAATLTEVLRCGHGMEESCDYHEFAFAFQFRDAQAVVNLVQEWQRAGRMLMPQSQQEGVLFAMVLDMGAAGLLTVGRPASDVGRLAAYLLAAGPLFRMWGPNKESVVRMREEVRTRLNLAIGEAEVLTQPIQFHDVITEAIVFPTNLREANAPAKVVEHAQRYYEDAWIHQPRRSLAGNTPIDAAGHTNLRKKLRGVLQFIQQCAAGSLMAGYDFDRLHRKLGLLEAVAAPTQSASEGSPADVNAMSAAELAGLKTESLTDEQLEQAFQAAQKLDAPDLAASFARDLTARPPRPERTDKYLWYAFLTQHALKSGQLDAALDTVNEGERVDCEQNEGRRRNDYELRRGQVHVKRGEVDAAADVFQRLIERAPDELKYRGSAADAMLSLKQPARALKFAEEGLAAARQRGDRDTEQYLLELEGAAKKQMG